MTYRRATCRHCSAEMADSGTRLGLHLSECGAYQERLGNNSGLSNSGGVRQLRVHSFLDRMNANEQALIDRALGDFIFGLGLPLCLVSAPHFKSLMNTLRPAYKPPSREAISTTVLDSHYDMVYANVLDTINAAESVSLVLDSWTNRRNESVVGFTVTTPKPFFLKAIFAGENRHTANFYFEAVSNIIQELGRAKVTAVVTDNAAAMRSMWRLVEDSFPGIVCLGCAAHTLNLLLGDVFELDDPKFILKTCKDVCKLFAYSSIADATFQRNRREPGITSGLVQPVKTRWASYLDCLQSVLKNKVALQQSILMPAVASQLDGQLRNSILSEGTFAQIAELLSFLVPIKGLIAVAEADSSSASKMFKSYFEFLREVRSLTFTWKADLECILDRRGPILSQPVLLLSCVLDPEDQGRSLEGFVNNFDREVEKAVELLIPDLSAREVIFAQLMQYRARAGPFESRVIWTVAERGILDAISWWKSSSRAPELSSLAIRVLGIPLSSASIERVWSTYDMIHSQTRSRLDNERAAKLVFIYKNLRSMEDE